MSEVIFEDPPQSTRTNRVHKWDQILQPLVDNPGRWARIHEGKLPSIRSTAAALKAKKNAESNGKWDFVSRKDPDQPEFGYVYARYNEGGDSNDVVEVDQVDVDAALS